jgi:POT family proton-dependent oligopeptide transporter
MLSSASVTTARQPAALPILGLAEIGDRFGYYALISVFVLYLTDIHRIDESHAFLIFGVFMSLASLATLAGGFAADHLFGFGRSIIFGAVLLIAGFAALAVAGADETLFAALALIAVGNGLTTANMPALLGQFYDDQDQHRAAGFTYLYMAINVGAFLGMIAMGLVAARYGYGAAFAMVAGVKLLGLAVYLAGRPWLRAHDGPPAATPTRRWQSLGLLALLLIAVATAVLLAHPADTSGILLLVAGIALGACLVALAIAMFAAGWRSC